MRIHLQHMRSKLETGFFVEILSGDLLMNVRVDMYTRNVY